MKEESVSIILGILVVISLFGFLGWTVYNIKASIVCERGIVLDVGGCDESGYCGVQLFNGFIGHAQYPVKGGSFEACRRNGR